jgi:general secretion pathway protein D
VALVPLEQLGAVVVFASTSNLLDRVEFWAKQVDKPGQGLTQRYFIYQPKYARASDLGESLAPLLGGVVPNAAGSLARDTRSALGNNDPSAINKDTAMRRDSRQVNAAPGVISIQGDGGLTLSIDSRSNSLIFYTTGPRYESLLPMIRRLDVPPKQIVLEATIAEVSLSGDFAQGVEFAFTRNQDVASGNNAFRMTAAAASSAAAADQLNGGTLGRLGLPSSGLALNYIMNATDQVRLRLSASDSRVNIISNPILVVRDGVGATISVGSDIPTVGATASDPIQSNRVVTTVLYRKTGLELDITPTINAQGLVVMRIAQTISNTVPGSSDVQGAPVFFERSISTEVVAGSGQTVLLGGLISESGSNSSAGVPMLSRIPVLGSAFRSDQKKKDKTELVLLITPRILESGADWDSVRTGIGRALKYLDLSEVSPPPKAPEATPEP